MYAEALWNGNWDGWMHGLDVIGGMVTGNREESAMYDGRIYETANPHFIGQPSLNSFLLPHFLFLLLDKYQ